MEDDVFEALCTRFLFTNYNHAGPNSTSGELNSLLNQLNDACHNSATKINPKASTFTIKYSPSIMRLSK